MKQRKFTLEEKEIPENWYNIVADMPNKPLPPLNPGTLEPIGPEALAPLFPMALIEQEVSTEKWITIPDEVRNLLFPLEANTFVSCLWFGKSLGYSSENIL